MFKSYFILAVLFLLASCQQDGSQCGQEGQVACAPTTSQENQQSSPQEQEEQDQSEQDDHQDHQHDEVPHEAKMFDASLKLTHFDAQDERKLMKAIDIIKKVVASREFMQRVLNFSYKGKKGFVDNNGKSNAEVYQALLDASENLNPGIDHQMDLELELYYSRRSTVGYTYPDEMKIWMNTKFFDVYTPAEVAGNVFHEWTHKLGFEHAYRYSDSRDYSVPYALGYLIRELGKKYE